MMVRPYNKTVGQQEITNMYQQKMWTFQGLFADHRKVFLHLPRIFGTYVGANAIEPSLNESVMVTVNSENSCPYL